MTGIPVVDGIATARLTPNRYAKNFAELHPPLDAHEARVEADRCYFCFDAPCQVACPTAIDIPLFIREIATGNTLGAAKTIFDQNILGGMCARVCPTETLCEQVCVRQTAEGNPVRIGRLQRYATDAAMLAGEQVFVRAPGTGKKVAIVGAGPAGLACAHRLATHGHQVTIYDARPKAGGLNEYGLAIYKTVDNFAQAEIDYILGIGGIEILPGKTIGADITFAALQSGHDAVFLGVGLAGTNSLGIEGESLNGVGDAVDFIARLRQADDLAALPAGHSVMVIGGGMTAIDMAVQIKKLGAQNVTIAYRRGPRDMPASRFEQELALTNGVTIRHWSKPVALEGADGRLIAVTLEDTSPGGGGARQRIEIDQLFKAIGQKLVPGAIAEAGIAMDGGRITVNHEGRTSLQGVWAGGDCTGRGEDLTVTAVAQGRDAAESINLFLAG